MGSWMAPKQETAARMSRSALRNAALTVAAVFALGVVVPAIFGPAEHSGRAARGQSSAQALPAGARTVQDGARAHLGAPLEDLRAGGEGGAVTPTT